MAVIDCPKCEIRKFPTRRIKNRWVEWFEGKCECGWDFMLKDNQFDYIQPTHPLFYEIYPDSQYEKSIKKQQEIKKHKLNLKDERDISLKLKVKQGRLKPWELKDIKKIAEERGID